MPVYMFRANCLVCYSRTDRRLIMEQFSDTCRTLLHRGRLTIYTRGNLATYYMCLHVSQLWIDTFNSTLSLYRPFGGTAIS